MDNIQSCYIHIPFCKRHCPYCDFAVFIDQRSQYHSNYIDKLIYEIASRSTPSTLKTLYFGGGTPSILSGDLTEKLFEALHRHFTITSTTEITIEINPGTVDKYKLQTYKDLGINRLSIGVQTFDEASLNSLNRGHTVSDVYETINLAQNLNYENISIDLIYGLPNQSLDSWQQSIQTALSLSIPHISCYSLMIETDTPFSLKYTPTHPDLPAETTLSQMYTYLCETLNTNNFSHYEVSNFALPGYESKHNMTYWSMKPYYGFGVGAHEYINSQRQAHTKSLLEYLSNPLNLYYLETDIQLEELMLSLRTKQGLNLQNYQQKYNVNISTNPILQKLQEKNLISFNDQYLSLTEEGFLLSNEIITQLI